MCVVGGCECARMNAHVHMVIHIAQMSSHTVRHPEMCVCVHARVCAHVCVCACVCVCVCACVCDNVYSCRSTMFTNVDK